MKRASLLIAVALVGGCGSADTARLTTGAMAILVSDRANFVSLTIPKGTGGMDSSDRGFVSLPTGTRVQVEADDGPSLMKKKY